MSDLYVVKCLGINGNTFLKTNEGKEQWTIHREQATEMPSSIAVLWELALSIKEPLSSFFVEPANE